MDQPDHADAHEIEKDHGSRVDGQVHDVGGRAKYGGGSNASQHSSADMLEEEFGVDYTHHPGEAEYDGHLKNHSQSPDNAEEKRTVLVDGDDGMHFLSLLNQKFQSYGKDHAIAEEPAT